mmetsp:Transcript_47692/g.153466  ORF Transcript_47692/g.153466 Transcript_47692/m.153466 type:complete len:231 (-) Transcript_47692:115-807(-)
MGGLCNRRISTEPGAALAPPKPGVELQIRQPLNAPVELQSLADVPESLLDSPRILRWLIILLGDLHQPLHWLRGDFDYGRAIEVAWEGKRSTLLDFWEDVLPRRAAAALPLAETFAREFQEKAMTWGYYTPPELFRMWAQESAGLACSEVYGPLRLDDVGGARNASGPIELTPELVDRWSALCQTTAVRAAEHLAFLLEDVLEHRHGRANARGGRGLAEALYPKDGRDVL